MIKLILMFAVLALIGNSMASPEQKAASEAWVKKLELPIMAALGLVVIWFAAMWNYQG